MDDRTLTALMNRIEQLERESVRLRLGEITDEAPLSVALGASDVAYEDVKATGPAALGDVVAALRRGNDIVVLGALGDGSALEATTDVTFATNWGNVVGVEEARYFKDPFGIVHIEGAAIRSSSGFTFNGAGATIFTLPAGYRPEKLRVFLCRGYDGTDYYPQAVLVNTDGTVVVAGASGRRADGNAPTAAVDTQSFLDGITFRPAGA